MRAPTDEELMADYADRDDPVAFEQIYRRYVSPLCALFSRTGSNDAESRDLVQQTFLQLHRARRDYRRGERVRPWLYAIAMNVGRGAVRTARRRMVDPEPIEEVDAVEAVRPSSAPEDVSVQRALSKLPADQRDVIVLHWFGGLEFAEIAGVVDASLSAVKVRAHRGYVRLRELLEEPA
ncbi:MAG TPA: RNA polymerase sigma factor [Myxococcota bacterium]|nr:RNA polymerase sigma factor [Myxococcota bacterium]